MDFRSEPSEYLFKILVIGDLATGKTSFIRRYVHQLFNTHYRATIGVDFALKVIPWDANTIVRIQLWDIAGQERFGSMTRVYYKDAMGALICYDVSKHQTFEAVIKWKEDLDSKVTLPDGSPIPAVLVANKCDLNKNGSFANSSVLEDFCQKHSFVGWYFASAKENINIEETATFLVSEILSASGKLKVRIELEAELNWRRVGNRPNGFTFEPDGYKLFPGSQTLAYFHFHLL